MRCDVRHSDQLVDYTVGIYDKCWTGFLFFFFLFWGWLSDWLIPIIISLQTLRIDLSTAPNGRFMNNYNNFSHFVLLDRGELFVVKQI